MKDPFGRTINYLRISVTDRCDLRCRYCMPAKGVVRVPMARILSFEEILELARIAVDMGVDKIRLTGGEPLVRRGIERLVHMLAQIPGVRDLAMTTNAQQLQRLAPALAEAGLMRVNISLDTLDAQVFTHLTRGGDLQKTLDGIAAARAAGLTPIKLNCVVQRSADEPHARAVADFAQKEGLQARFIQQMDFESGYFAQVDGGDGGDCPRCNRLRLSADGRIRPCLFSDLGFSVRELGPKRALIQALQNKPLRGGRCAENPMRGVGG